MRAAGIVQVQKRIRAMLLVNRTVMLIIAGNALEFFTRSEKITPSSVDLSDICMSFRVESNTTIRIYMDKDVLLINEVHNVIERKSVFENRTTIWYNINFWTQNGINCKLCRIFRTDLGYFVGAQCFLQREILSNFDKGWALNFHRRQVLMRNFTKGWVRWYMEEASCCCWERFLNIEFAA